MTPERWAQIEELFHRAAECEADQRTYLLDVACKGDEELRREVEKLLSNEENASDRMMAAVQCGLEATTYPLLGETISHYHILEGLGGGGMGLIYRAEDIKLGRQVALKFLPEESAKDPAALGRFEREARSASALEHPNICPIYEFGEHEGEQFLVMQLLEGQTLRELISAAGPGKAPFTLDKLLNIAVQVADGLEVAHRHRIIHRDIKPANIFVTTQGQAKILDFGLAKLSLGEAVRDHSEPGTRDAGAPVLPVGELAPLVTPDPLLSRTGVAMGTAGYMSPEQARGEKLDARTDLFSFGLVLYEMATGQRAFKGDTRPVLHDAILRSKPRPARELNPTIPTKLEAILNKALEKDREARYQAASELAVDLKNLNRQLQPKPRAIRWLGSAAGVLALSSVAIIFWVVKRQPPIRPQPKLRQLTINSSENPVMGGAISPDGKYLAYGDAKGIHIKFVGPEEQQVLPQPELAKNDNVVWEIVSTAWFPDSKRFLANAHPASESQSAWSSQTSSIWMFSVLGGAPSKLRDHAVAWSVSPDGSSISFGTSKGRLGDRELWLMGPNGEQVRRLYEVDEKNAICCLYFVSNGQRVSYITTNESGDTLAVRDLNGGPVTTLLTTSETKIMGDFSWLPDGRLIYSDKCPNVTGGFDTPCNYWIERFDTSTGELIEKPRRLTNWAGVWMNGPSTTADGKRIVFLKSSGRGTSYIGDLEGGGTRLVNLRPFTLEEGGEDILSSWTADSKTVILEQNRGDHYGLYKQSLNSDTPEPIVATVAGSLLETAVVSPDGKWVIIQVWPITGGDIVRIMRVPIDGGTLELVFPVREWSLISCARPPSTLCALAEQSEDHKQMTVTSFDPVRGRGLELARFELDSDYDAKMNYLLWSVSRDGTHLAAARGPEGPIQIRSLPSGPTQVIRAKGLDRLWYLYWAADGKGLIVSNRTKGSGSEILHLDLNGNANVLWRCSGDRCTFKPSPDGYHLAIYDWKVNANIWMMENF